MEFVWRCRCSTFHIKYVWLSIFPDDLLIFKCEIQKITNHFFLFLFFICILNSIILSNTPNITKYINDTRYNLIRLTQPNNLYQIYTIYTLLLTQKTTKTPDNQSSFFDHTKLKIGMSNLRLASKSKIFFKLLYFSSQPPLLILQFWPKKQWSTSSTFKFFSKTTVASVNYV